MKKIALEQGDKKLFKLSTLLGIFFTLILIVLAICKVISYKVVVSFLIGVLTGNALHYLTIQVINKAKVESYKMIVRQLSILKQLIYIATLVAIYFLTRDIWAFIACVAGITIIKLAIVIFVLMEKKHG